MGRRNWQLRHLAAKPLIYQRQQSHRPPAVQPQLPKRVILLSATLVKHFNLMKRSNHLKKSGDKKAHNYRCQVSSRRATTRLPVATMKTAQARGSMATNAKAS